MANAISCVDPRDMIKQITLIIVTIKRFKQVRVVSACGIYEQVLKHVLPCINGQTDACIFNIVTARLTNAVQ